MYAPDPDCVSTPFLGPGCLFYGKDLLKTAPGWAAGVLEAGSPALCIGFMGFLVSRRTGVWGSGWRGITWITHTGAS